jgi:hypothetical protein
MTVNLIEPHYCTLTILDYLLRHRVVRSPPHDEREDRQPVIHSRPSSGSGG